MFIYDQELSVAVADAPASIADVIHVMQEIDANCLDTDGLKWFNWLYLQVTKEVQTHVQSGAVGDPLWLADLDVQFARLYFGALHSFLEGNPTPECWQELFQRRNDSRLGRIQFALAGINAHINHDLPEALVATGQLTAPHYADYTALNATLDSLIEAAKKTLMVRLPGDPLPAVSQLEDALAGWSVAAVRETAWQNAEILSHLGSVPQLSANFLNTLDVLTRAGNGVLLVAI